MKTKENMIKLTIETQMTTQKDKEDKRRFNTIETDNWTLIKSHSRIHQSLHLPFLRDLIWFNWRWCDDVPNDMRDGIVDDERWKMKFCFVWVTFWVWSLKIWKLVWDWWLMTDDWLMLDDELNFDWLTKKRVSALVEVLIWSIDTLAGVRVRIEVNSVVWTGRSFSLGVLPFKSHLASA